MSIKKNFLKSKPVCKVTFTLPADAVNGAKEVLLMGEFNEWNLDSADTMRKLKDGSYTRTLDLDAGQSYQFRYLLDGENWINDTEADAYVPSGIGADENCVVEL